MKRLLAMVLIGLFCATGAFAAEWGEGLGPDQPLPGVRKLDLNREMGYSYTYPRPGLEVSYYCNVLEIYLPREDIALGDGHAHLYDSTGEVADIDFANPDQVHLRPQQESELVAKKWGSGVCIEMYLPVSLKFGESYYVLMDLNCFTACDGRVSNYDLAKPDQWTPALQGDYGIGGLFYCAPPASEEVAEGGETADAPDAKAPEGTAEPEQEPAAGEPKYNPVTGDMIQFDLLLGGDAKTAVVFSENNSALFDQIEYTESGHVTGSVQADDLDWGVVFLDENNELLQVIKPAQSAQSGDQEAGEEAEQEAGEEAGQDAEQEAGQDAGSDTEQETAPEAGQDAAQAE